MLKSIGNRIRKNRIDKGMTQEQLASILGYTKQAVSKWENGLSALDITVLPQIVNILGISFNKLLGEEGVKIYTINEKKALLSRCLDEAGNANKICDMLDRWSLENREIKKTEDKYLLELGRNINSPIRCLGDVDILDNWHFIHEKQMGIWGTYSK